MLGNLTRGSRARLGGALAIIVGTILVLAGPTPAQAATARSTGTNAESATVASDQGVTFHSATPYGVLTYGWRPLSGKQSAATPLSASGCNQDVCIEIVGSSNHVDSWSTQAYWDGGYICTRSRFWINNNVIRTGTVVCGGAGVFFTDWPANRYFPSPSLACNTWTAIPGKPCETIRK